ncbi:MAG TPA: hypothetical protein VIY90_16360 [Steroidobacteraceae bacterium]
MKPIDPVELSGFIDGEMTEERSQEIRQLAANTQSLREELESLSRTDSRWCAAARSAAFRVEIRLHRERLLAISAVQAALLVAILLAVRFLPKLMHTLSLGLALNGIALAIVIAWVITLAQESERRMSTLV